MKELIQEIKNNLDKRYCEDEAIRLFHGRGDCFSILPNINIDYFPPAIVIMQYRDDNSDKEAIIKAIESLMPEQNTIYWQNRYLPRATWGLLRGEALDSTTVSELDVKYKITFLKNQNMGLFLDMKEGRKHVASLSRNKTVLNLFSYTCPFSVVAMKNGAKSVLNMDMSKGVLSTGKLNHKLNDLDLSKVKFLSHDIFKSFGKLKKNGPFDLVIADPPSAQGKSFSLEKSYPRLLKRLPEFMAIDADVLLCLNSPFHHSDYLLELVAQYCPTLTLKNIYFSPDEFKEIDKQNGVKILHFINNG